MDNEWRIGCGGADVPAGDGENLQLDIRPDANPRTAGNVRLGIEAVRQAWLAECPPILLDVLEIATYVYVADQASSRGRPGDLGTKWPRSLTFRIPVRNPKRWSDPQLADLLIITLQFLTQDEYNFEFIKRAPTTPPNYFTFNDRPLARPVDEVMLFSGGLDSLAGAVEETVAGKRHALLVQHRSTPKLQPRHDELLAELTRRATAAGGCITHFPVTVNKDEELTESFTQRSRSFLFVSLAAVMAALVGRDKIRFFENGIVSFNLPISPAVVGARASRTTHPRVLAGYSCILSTLCDRPIEVENPFLWKTRADVARTLAAVGCEDLIRLSTSCGATRGMTSEQPHCGMCTQCIDRRFAILAAHQSQHDPATGYRIDVITGDRSDGDPRIALAAFLDMVERVELASGPVAFFSMFGEAMRILGSIGGSAGSIAQRVFNLYKQHAGEVNAVLDAQAAENITKLRLRQLPESCTLRLVHDRHLPPELRIASCETSDARRKRRTSKRGSRAAKIECLSAVMIQHLIRARDHAYTTRDTHGHPVLLPRPSRKLLAKATGMSASTVTRCFDDPLARELNIYWDTADDLEAILRFVVPKGGDRSIG